jgi:hypothetical protein
VASVCATRYRARNPRATPLYRLSDAHFDITEHDVIDAILRHLKRKGVQEAREPPN